METYLQRPMAIYVPVVRLWQSVESRIYLHNWAD